MTGQFHPSRHRMLSVFARCQNVSSVSGLLRRSRATFWRMARGSCRGTRLLHWQPNAGSRGFSALAPLVSCTRVLNKNKNIHFICTRGTMIGVAWRGVSWGGRSWGGVAWRGVAGRGVAWRGVSWRAALEITACPIRCLPVSTTNNHFWLTGFLSYKRCHNVKYWDLRRPPEQVAPITVFVSCNHETEVAIDFGTRMIISST